MTDGSASVGAALRAGFSDLKASIGACWAALACAALLSAAGGRAPVGLGLFLVVLAGVVAQGALFRRAFNGPSGFKGLRLGRDELRLLAVHLLSFGFFLVIAAVLLVVIGAIALGVARVAAPNFDGASSQAWKDAFAAAGPAGVFVGLVPLASLAILIWLSLRLAFAAPATVDQAGVRVLSAFPLTKGRVLPLFLTGLALATPFIGVSTVLSLLLGRGALAGLAIGALTYFYFAPAWAGALVHFYRQSAVTQDA